MLHLYIRDSIIRLIFSEELCCKKEREFVMIKYITTFPL